MNLHLAEIANEVAPGKHAVLVLDQAGWHLSARLAVPDNVTLIVLPPPISPPATCFRPWSARWPPLDVVRGTREPISQAQCVAATSSAASSHSPSRRRDLWEQAIGGLLDPLSLSLSSFRRHKFSSSEVVRPRA